MKNIRSSFILVAGAALLTAGPALAQTTHQTKVDTDTSVSNGVATTTTTQTHTTKRTTRQPKKVLGVKVGHKTAVHQTVKKTSVSTNGDSSTTVKTK
ncbi:hypothetical protein HL653_17620 [Sphingomonas sp. AP4-R1]|uniref:hypothetical protein n=1 Tax=Sphingomonas sp. AP4-R1 TaxID=2735134 RepID=UPI0014934C62|nr:hypothetical protein [Sphingomonas sp. AP4-R1]QJU59335.1 hypothetical protein HL653_17620 [Sphingomonas sp. AP4-R1]